MDVPKNDEGAYADHRSHTDTETHRRVVCGPLTARWAAPRPPSVTRPLRGIAEKRDCAPGGCPEARVGFEKTVFQKCDASNIVSKLRIQNLDKSGEPTGRAEPHYRIAELANQRHTNAEGRGRGLEGQDVVDDSTRVLEWGQPTAGMPRHNDK